MNKKLLNKLTIRSNATILQAIKKLENNSFQILFVLNSKKNFLGSLTDGDIRRFLLKKPDLTSKIVYAINKNAYFLNKKTSLENLEQIFFKKKIHQIPLINKDKKLINVYFSNFFNKKKIYNNPVVIMAGGLGSRMGLLTQNCPKPMLPINGKPILEHIILKLKINGFVNIKISVNYLKDQIINYFKDGKKFGVNIKYIIENKALGTAGSLKFLENNIKTKDLIVLNGDIISSVNISNLLAFHKKNKSFATMAVRDYEIQNKYGVVITHGTKITKFIEKPIIKNYINAGVYVLNKNIINFIDTNKKIDMPKLFLIAKKNQKLISACPVYENWMDIGSNEDYSDVLKIENK